MDDAKGPARTWQVLQSLDGLDFYTDQRGQNMFLVGDLQMCEYGSVRVFNLKVESKVTRIKVK